MSTRTVDYVDSGAVCEGFVAEPAGGAGPRPVIVVSHAWAGQDDFAREKAKALAALGYVGFALDNYGKGRRGSNNEENAALMGPLVNDRAMLRRRLLAGVEAARGLPGVDRDRVGAIGFCFGGLCALDLARANAPGLKGVVAFHGLLGAPNVGAQARISAKILALHGWDDPLATPETVLAFAKEMTDARADWQLHAYGHCVHAFTNPNARDTAHGLHYNETADRRSWIAMKNFFAEIFG
jgi:dienelactone hydrolase